MRKTRFLAGLVSATVVLGSLGLPECVGFSGFGAATVEAATVVESGSCGDDVTYVLDSTGTLTISGTGYMESYSWDTEAQTSTAPWFNDESITKVVIEEGVTSIGSYAFSITPNLTEVEIADTVTSIGGGAFYKCSSLESIEIPDSVTSFGYSVFEACYGLKHITLSKNLTGIPYWTFCNCSSLESIDIPEGVTFIGYSAFYGCFCLSDVEIPDGVEYIMYYAFSDCYSLTSISLPDTIKSIETYAFDNCMFLSEVYYAGSENDWEEINIGGSNTYLKKATFTYGKFNDVADSYWGSSAIYYLRSRGIMNGTSSTTFSPSSNLTRGQLAVMVWNTEGQPWVKDTSIFSDVASGKYYTKAVNWATSNDIIHGSDGLYNPGDYITRQDIAVILRNYAKYLGLDVSVDDTSAYKECSDYKNVSAYALSSIQWAYERGFIGANGTLNAKGYATRAEAAAMIQRFLKYYGI